MTLVHGPLKVVPGAGGQTFGGVWVSPRFAVVGSAMQTFPIMGCAGAPASRTSPVDARNPNRRIDARRRALSLVFNYRLTSSALQDEFDEFRNIYALGERFFDFPFDERFTARSFFCLTR